MEEIINCAAYAEGRRIANVELENTGEIRRASAVPAFLIFKYYSLILQLF